MTIPAGGFRSLALPSRFRAWDDRVNGFYVPVLSRAIRYDRLVGYWRSSSLIVAATGLSYFAQRRGTMRVIAGAELTEPDIEAIRAGRPLDDALAQRLISEPEQAADIVAQHRWEVIAWLLNENLLEIRIGVPVDEAGVPLSPGEAKRLFHSKFGVYEDEAGDRIAFSGSDNESAAAWRDNHEVFHVYRSWASPDIWSEYGQPTVDDFEQHWSGTIPKWKVIEFPDEARDHLLRHLPSAADWVPPPDPEAAPPKTIDGAAALEGLRRIAESPQVDGGTGVGFVTAPIQSWPHQTQIAARILEMWPRSYLLADEVGLGKTIEAGLVIRELLLTGRADRILLLVPASVQRQWQEELWEKFCLDVPSYNGKEFVTVSGETLPNHDEVNPWSAHQVVLASSHLARRKDRRRQLLEAGGWDLVLVDEAHHARRRGTGAESANQLLQTLRELRDAQQWRALILATATPMQMHTHEVFDLLDLLGLPGRWGASHEFFEEYYRQLARPDPRDRDWSLLRSMLADFMASDAPKSWVAAERVKSLPAPSRMNIEMFHRKHLTGTQIAARPPTERAALDAWLRANTPLKDRVFRTTRDALREYQREGILSRDAVIPRRRIDDRMIKFGSKEEEDLYKRVEDYISRYYEAYNADKATKPLGFIMTIYRRRLTSSLHAVRTSLRRRLEGLEGQMSIEALLDDDDRFALETSTDSDLEVTQEAEARKAEIDELRSFISELDSAVHNDTKVQALTADIKASFDAAHRTVVVFTQYTDTMKWLREHLRSTYGSRVATYSGEGGSQWNAENGEWETKSKAEIKELFRQGQDVRILLGTDAMSEGLNLQTCGRLINYDMPWNFMRVEQRIGRIDRIGGQPKVYVTNYFYEDTIEEQVYSGIKEDADWFEHVVGPAQPVLSQVETVIQDLAMRRATDARRRELEDQLAEVRRAIAGAKEKAVSIHTMDQEGLPTTGYASVPAITLDEIEEIFTTNPLTRDRFREYPGLARTYWVEVEGGKHLMTFDRQVNDQDPEVGFMTYCHPVFESLMLELPDR